MKIVLDTNIVVSGLLQSQGNPAQVLTLAVECRSEGPWRLRMKRDAQKVLALLLNGVAAIALIGCLTNHEQQFFVSTASQKISQIEQAKTEDQQVSAFVELMDFVAANRERLKFGIHIFGWDDEMKHVGLLAPDAVARIRYLQVSATTEHETHPIPGTIVEVTGPHVLSRLKPVLQAKYYHY